jgi:Leucine-rich repeat (LRR) protein
LETVHLGDNNLTAVPASIGSLTALTTLSLYNNRFATLPSTIGGMTALTTLYLHNNQLAGLPDAIGQLAGLKKLWLCRMPRVSTALVHLIITPDISSARVDRSTSEEKIRKKEERKKDREHSAYTTSSVA